MKTALLVVDVQRALCEGEYAAFQAPQVVSRINGLITRARAAGAPVLFVQHEDTEGPMRRGEDGWQLALELDADPADPAVHKRVCDAFDETDLHALLQTHGVGKLVVCGFQSDFCIAATTRRALALGYPVTLVSDGHSTLDCGGVAAAQITAQQNEALAGGSDGVAGATLQPAAAVAFAESPTA